MDGFKVAMATYSGLTRGQQDSTQAVLSKSGETLSTNEEIFERWKEHFVELLNLVDTPSNSDG